MTVTQEAYEVAGQILELPIALIRPAPDNVRTDLGDLEGLRASIAEVGVLQPITVVPIAKPKKDGPEFEAMIGHRRLAAAELQGLMTIPAIVRAKPEDVTRTMAMLIENVQRLDISAIDEARTFERLEHEFGMDQDRIANAVGCSQGHVSKRLSLLLLPETVRAMIKPAGDLGINDALELTKLADHPDVIAELVKSWDRLDPEERRWEIEAEVEKAEHADAVVAEVAKLTAKGLTIIDADQAKRMARVVVDGDYHPTGKLLVLAEADVKKHAKEPCHAVHVATAEFAKFDAKRATRFYCTSADRHDPKGDSTLKAIPKKTQAKESPAVAEENRRRTERVARRRAFVSELVRERKLAKGDVVTVALTRVALEGWPGDHAKTAELLGLDLKGRDATTAIKDFIQGGHDALLRAGLASMLRSATDVHLDSETEALLTAFGYEPSEDELLEQLVDAATDVAREIFDRALEVTESDQDEVADPIWEELQEGNVSMDRVRELRAILDARFGELNNLQPGDVVSEAPDGDGHTIERAAAIDTLAAGSLSNDAVDELEAARSAGNTQRWHAYGAISPTSQTQAIVPLPADEEPAATIELGGNELELIASYDEKPSEVEVSTAYAAKFLGKATGGVKGCPFPLCQGELEHDGNHTLKLTFAKDPKDCGNDEAWDRLAIQTALNENPTDEELRGIYAELGAGVDEPRAAEIRAALAARDTRPALTDYAAAAVGAMEKSCREIIATLPPEHPRVAELQQELYAGVPSSTASAIKKELKRISATLERPE